MPVSEAALEAVGGAVGSVISMAATYPLSIVSTWQGLEHKGEHPDIIALRKLFRLVPSPIKEMFIYGNHKGWPSLFAGLPPVLGATAVSQGLYFYLYSTMRSSVVAHRSAAATYNTGNSNGASSRTQEIGILGSMLVASLAGCGSVLATNPAWVIAAQLQSAHRGTDPEMKNMGVLEVAKRLYKENGIKGFWQGIWPSLVMVLNPTLQYILYEQLIAQLLRWKRVQAELAGGTKRMSLAAAQLNSTDVFLLSALAKLGSTLVTYPLLIVKTRLQALSSSTDEEARYTGVVNAVRTILKAEGIHGFYKGLNIKIMQTVLAAALLMSIKEQVFGVTKALLTGSAAKVKSDL